MLFTSDRIIRGYSTHRDDEPDPKRVLFEVLRRREG